MPAAARVDDLSATVIAIEAVGPDNTNVTDSQIKLGNCLAEYIAMLLFVFVCCGAATGVAKTPGWIQQVSLTFGFCIFALALAFGRWGLQCNCAVTFGLAIAKTRGIGDMGLAQAVANVAAQLLGSISGAALVAIVKGETSDMTQTLAVNMLAPDIGLGEAFAAEILGTFLLMFVVMQAITDEQPKDFAPLAIGMAVYLAHSVLIPVDGCSINPTRSFGPAVVATIRLRDKDDRPPIWDDHWIFWLGPLAGSALAVGVHVLMSQADKAKA